MKRLANSGKPQTVSETFKSVDGRVLCPFCPKHGDIFVHMESVEVDQLGDVTYVDGDGARNFMRDSEYVRGSVVKIVFQCEGTYDGIEHRFQLRLQFHKGCTLVETQFLKAIPYDDDDSRLNNGTGITFLRRD